MYVCIIFSSIDVSAQAFPDCDILGEENSYITCPGGAFIFEPFDPGTGNGERGMRILLQNPYVVQFLSVNISWDIQNLLLLSTTANPTFAAQNASPIFNMTLSSINFQVGSFASSAPFIDLTGSGSEIEIYSFIYTGEIGQCYNFLFTQGVTTIDKCGSNGAIGFPCSNITGDVDISATTTQCIDAFTISGLVESVGVQCDNSINYGVEGVDIAITQNGSQACNTVTDNAGDYSCQVGGGSGYMITPSKTNGMDCGITTLDITETQAHIFGISVFTEPWEFMAADANDNLVVSVSDLVTMQNVINSTPGQVVFNHPASLGTIFESWNFAPSFEFGFLPTPTVNVPNLNSFVEINNITSDLGLQEFVGIKNGDINGSCTDCMGALTQNQLEARESIAPLDISITNQSVRQGEVIEIPFQVNGFDRISTYGFGMEISPEHFEIVKIIKSDIDGNQAYSKINAAAGTFKSVWFSSDVASYSLEDGTTLFTLQLRAKQDVGSLEGLIKFKESVLENKIYSILDATVASFNLEIEGVLEKNQVNVFPNPFDAEIIFDLTLTQDEAVQILIFDNLGKQVYHKTQPLGKGNHQLRINSLSQLPVGIYFYQINTPTWTASHKLQKLK